MVMHRDMPMKGVTHARIQLVLSQMCGIHGEGIHRRSRPWVHASKRLDAGRSVTALNPGWHQVERSGQHPHRDVSVLALRVS